MAATETGNDTEKLTLPLELVVTVAAPRKRAPSLNPVGSAVGLEKNSMRYVVFGRLLSVPAMLVVVALEDTLDNTG